MSFGRKRSKINTQSFDFLSSLSKSQLTKTQNYINQLSDELIQPPALESRRIESYQKQLFDRLYKTINESASLRSSETRSDLAQRFGGSLNSTFGADLLSRVEGERLGAIEGAKLDSLLFGHQLAEDANTARIRKLQALQGNLSDLSSTYRNANYMKETLLRQDREDRAQNRFSLLSTVTNLIPF